MSQIPLSQISRVAVTGVGHLGSRFTFKQTAEYAAKHADAAVFEVAADSKPVLTAPARPRKVVTLLLARVYQRSYLR